MKSEIIQSTKWSGITEILAKIMTPLINIVLARLLTPAVFGVVATFTLVITFAEVFTDAGFQKYLVQHEFKDQNDREQSTNVAFWTNFSFSCFVWLLIFIFRDEIASLVGSDGYGVQITIMSLNIPMVALSSIQMALYRRDFRFKQLLPVRVVACITPLVITVPLAAVFRNSWAMVVGSLAKEITLVIMLRVRSNWKPKFFYSFKKLREMLLFSAMMMADSFMVWFTSYAGTFIISRCLNDYYTGIYKTGSTTISTYMNLVYMIAAPVLFSALSRLQNDREECNKVYFSFQHYCAFVVIPLGFGVFIFRDFVTQILLGSQWGDASLILGCTGLTMGVSIITAQFNSDYFRAQGKPALSLLVQGAYAVVMVVVFLIIAKQSFVYLSIAQGGIRMVYCVISTAVLCIVFKMSVFKILKNIRWSLLASGVMSIVAWLMLQLGSSLVWNLLSVFVCIVVYFGVLVLIPPTRKEVISLDIIQKAIKRLKR